MQATLWAAVGRAALSRQRGSDERADTRIRVYDDALSPAGKDTLKGGAGKDKLKGGAGKDKQVQ